jgi:serine/threonine-protein kinase
MSLDSTFGSRYRLLDKLGEGGMGEVYAAEDVQLRRRVALKLPTFKDDSVDKNRFLQEARVASQLTHPNIARIYDFGTAPDGRPFMVMELIQGTSLKELLRRGPLTPDKVATVIAGVLRALSDAHAHNLVHRDIKPSNVMLTDSGEVKVLDFGLAKELVTLPVIEGAEVATTIGNVTALGMVVGTPAYMSPEQVRGGSVDPRSDLFSTGALLYECLTGVPPFAGSSTREILDQILIKDPVPPTARVLDLNREWDAVLGKALRKSPDERYQSAEAMLGAVERVVSARPGFSSRSIIASFGTRKRKAVAEYAKL